MKFACLVRFDPTRPGALARLQSEAFSRECLEEDERLEREGKLLFAQALEPVEATVTVRVRNGKLSATDGPFAETKEQIAGLVFIEARDRAEAIALASRSPFASLGCVEVRPLMERSARWPGSKGGRRGLPGGG